MPRDTEHFYLAEQTGLELSYLFAVPLQSIRKNETQEAGCVSFLRA